MKIFVEGLKVETVFSIYAMVVFKFIFVLIAQKIEYQGLISS